MDGMHLQDRSVSVGRRQPSLLAREEWPLAVRGRRSAEPLQAKAGSVPDQPKREAVSGALRRQQRTTRMIGCRLIGMINGAAGAITSPVVAVGTIFQSTTLAAPDKAHRLCRARYQMNRNRP